MIELIIYHCSIEKAKEPLNAETLLQIVWELEEGGTPNKEGNTLDKTNTTRKEEGRTTEEEEGAEGNLKLFQMSMSNSL